MAISKFSRQREAIKAYLKSTTCHPTADLIYENVRKEYPNISLGTVYRNLSLLAEQGEILKLSCDDEKDHFDANTMPHHHFYCRCCHQVIDLPVPVFSPDQLINTSDFQGSIDTCITYFIGTCPTCITT